MDAFSKSTTPDGSRDLWETPPDVFRAIEAAIRIPFVHDVCADRETSKCVNYWGPDLGDDALIIDWTREISIAVSLNYGVARPAVAVWMNPPYSNPTPWVRKAAEEAAKGLIVVGLVIHDPSTKWFQQYVEGMASVAFVPDRRISFLQDGKPVNGNPKPSIFPVWTPWRTGHTQYVRFSLPQKNRAS
jgi:phage N-6-adenine-methyltransferase